MVSIDDEKFRKIVSEAIDDIPEQYLSRLDNVAFVVEDDPTPGQREQLGLRGPQTLFGLYEGAPLPTRGGRTKILPDKITIFKNPITRYSTSLSDLREQVRHTIWHEVAHYFGLDHGRIDELSRKPRL